MQKWNLQLILDKETAGTKDIFVIAESAIKGGADSIQLRDKVSTDKTIFQEASLLRKITAGRCLFIINDRVDIALAVGADGVHMGQDDMPYQCARRLLGSRKIIGISTHSLGQARAAQAAGADYIGVGPIFKTQTKPGLDPIGLNIVTEISREIKILPIFIGGIDLYNVRSIVERGGRSLAIASAIISSKDAAWATKSFIDILHSANRRTTVTI